MVELIINPIIVTALLTIAGIGIVLELFSPRFGIPGFIGITALLIYFYGHFQAGLAGYGTIALFVTGMVLIFLEFFLPGAIAGTLGVAALIASLFLAGGTGLTIGISLLLSLFLSIVFFFIMVKFFDKRIMLFNKMVLFDSARKEDGYVSNENRVDLLGMEGVALTTLRPAGTAIFNDERIDVVSEGSFIAQHSKVTVIKVEGARIVVREQSSKK
ncbi:NfeD family protein [Neobacillus sp. PS3-40]|uniref:NfeD family protein n=1 Tax=Neobacillus sp. PS3-40 TaxID=3070679 RepID=UPI0027DF3075|nr:NfeD family protein [Neobacillus sp. PS3-40]WML45353.1 NfeD family protein [Neobacillus sp. PS3-40]